MSTYFKNKLISEIGTTESEVISTASNATATVIGLSLTNLTGGIVLASIRLVDTVLTEQAYYAKDIVIPPNQSLRVINGGEKLVLAANMKLYVVANTPASLDLVASYALVT